MNVSLLINFLSAGLFFSIVLANGQYSETATLTYLTNYNLLADVNFKLKSQPIVSRLDDSIKSVDLGSFPSLIYGLSSEFGLLEGKISFTRGIWDTERWSKAPSNPTSSGFQFHGHFSNVHESNLGYRRAVQNYMELY